MSDSNVVRLRHFDGLHFPNALKRSVEGARMCMGDDNGRLPEQPSGKKETKIDWKKYHEWRREQL